MTNSPTLCNFAHAADVLRFVQAAMRSGEGCALVVVTNTEGGGVRAPGALMAVTESGVSAGYVSNGCVDADVIINAQAVMASGRSRTLRYGEGSPFLDIRLPCGGALEVLIIPVTDLSLIDATLDRAGRREPFSLCAGMEGLMASPDGGERADWDGKAIVVRAVPKLRLRIAGRGAEPVALARLVAAADMDAHLQSPDEDCLANAAAHGFSTERLGMPDSPPDCVDDQWTAFILMFHDHDWENGLLAQALRGEAFYIGALGSRRTHALRCNYLASAGFGEAEIARVKGPIGLIPRTRDASFLAISTLAEVAAAYLENTS